MLKQSHKQTNNEKASVKVSYHARRDRISCYYAVSQVLNNPLCLTLQRYGKEPQKPSNSSLSGRLGQSARVRNSFIYDLVLF